MSAPGQPLPQVSLPRLYVLRAAYLFIFVGVALTMWPPPLLAVPPLATLGLMIFWLLRVRLAKRFNASAHKRRLRVRPAAAAARPEPAAG